MKTETHTKHTPGPWLTAGMEIWAGSKRITIGQGSFDEKDKAVRRANARLIAAAPELLEACKLAQVKIALSEIGTENEAYKILGAAISAAEG